MDTKKLKNDLVMIAGACILSFGLFNVHLQSGVTEGGELGTELLLEHWFGISPSITSALFDTTLYLLGAFVLGRGFVRNAFLSTASFSLSYRLWEWMGPVLPSLSDWPLAAAILGALFVGFGCGMVVRIGGACGGDDVLALLLHKKLKQPLARCYFLADAVVLLLSLSYLPWQNIVYSFVTVTISSWLVGKISSFHIDQDLVPDT
ncbi:MAG: YitT family protein [Lactimicrobium sp.]|jgi:uncharacterized membrane-anchored protein YitT (DUF2179 family)|uniref:YitT family protein n=1 Tax=Lactimicrobium sp. TaxID=2563780 RepID=UPI002F358EF8